MRRGIALWTAGAVVLAATMLVGGAQVVQAGEFSRDSGPDFNCDDVRDAVVARYWEAVNGIDSAGAVIVTYGGSGRTQRITQASAGVPDNPEREDGFGQSYTWYDRNRDGCDELVLGTPGEDFAGGDSVGTVTIVPGALAGLATGGSVRYTQDSPGWPGRAFGGDLFGHALAAGRTQHGEPFLLIGSPGDNGREFETGGGDRTESSGSVYYLRGSTVRMIHQDAAGVPDSRETRDSFGMALAASERFFAVGSPDETVGSESQAGMVHVFSHTITNGRPTPVGAFHQNTPGITGVAERSDLFGFSLSVLSYRPTGGHPIGALVAVGSMAEQVGSSSAFAAGMAHLVYVSPQGAVREQAAVTQNTPGVSDVPEHSDRFGVDVVLANLHPDSNVAMPATMAWAVAVPGEVLDDALGLVHVFRPGWRPGDPDVVVDQAGLGLEVWNVERLRGTDVQLLMGEQESCHAVSWSDLLAGGPLRPEHRLMDDCV